MPQCSHRKLTLLAPKAGKLLCAKCHLLISSDELKGGYCPECYAVRGEKQYEFEEIAPDRSDVARYRCDECGAVIEWIG